MLHGWRKVFFFVFIIHYHIEGHLNETGIRMTGDKHHLEDGETINSLPLKVHHVSPWRRIKNVIGYLPVTFLRQKVA